MKRNKVLFPIILLSLSTLVGCNGKKQEPAPEEPDTPVTPTGPIENDSGLPTTISYLDEPGFMIHYQRTSGTYTEWDMWLWSDGLGGGVREFNYADDYGVIAYYPLSDFGDSKNIGFIVKQKFSVTGGEWKKDYNSDRFLDFDVLQKDEHGVYHAYILQKKAPIWTDAARTDVMCAVSMCEFSDKKHLHVIANKKLTDVALLANGTEVPFESKAGEKDFTVELKENAVIDSLYKARVTFEDKGIVVEKAVNIRKLYDEDFEAAYNYDGELGAIVDEANQTTTFKVWSPVSTSIKLRIYDNGTPVEIDPVKGSDVYQEFNMVKGDKGVFSYTANEMLYGKYYTYVVTNASNQNGTEVVDPYAKSAGVNGLRGMIVNFNDAKAKPEGWDDVEYLSYDNKELTVYETHVADTTSSATWTGSEANRKKYAGMYETGTTYTKGGKTVTTGFDHIKDLGVNAVQIIPIFDQANDEIDVEFNWGYNPLNYNCLEGAYSSNPHDGYARIKEFRTLVQKYNKEGIEIIMDVVYNHVNGLTGSNFNILMPGYYFRYDSTTGSPTSGSGCGNDTKSEQYMYRKFMIESTAFWLETYKLGGFRFDLMGLHDVDTMNQLTANLKTINPYVTVYGEPWSMAQEMKGDPSDQSNISKWNGYGGFNDHMRDGMISGGLSTDEDRAWVTNDEYSVNPTDILLGMAGWTGTQSKDPDKAVSYVTCHDNYTLHDRAIASNYFNEANIKRMNLTAFSIVFLSQGTSFMLGGEELLRTKIVYDDDGNPVPKKDAQGQDIPGVYMVSSNSYNSCYKTNEIDYERKVDNLDMMEYYQKLIALKQNLDGLHCTRSEVVANYSVAEANFVGGADYGSVLAGTIKEGDDTYRFFIANGSADGSYTVDVPANAELYLNTSTQAFTPGQTNNIAKFQTLIYRY